MDKKRVLIVTQELKPYTALSEVADMVKDLPAFILNKGMEIRVLMPKFGTINERRHRLHEVVRLSGMNIIVNDEDYPLIIKVASLPGARIQVYFLDNDEFFKRRSVFEDDKGQAFGDNAERMVFFCKGVIETVRKFGWAPDIVHCHGWMTSLIPFYLRTAYGKDPLFENSKIVYSLYNDPSERSVGEGFGAKASINNLTEADLDAFCDTAGTDYPSEGAMRHSDAVIKGSESFGEVVQAALARFEKPVLDYMPSDFLSAYLDFYNSLFEENVSK